MVGTPQVGQSSTAPSGARGRAPQARPPLGFRPVPVPPPTPRVYAIAILCSLVGQGALLFVISLNETAAGALVIFFLVEAVILGWVFGPLPGAVAAALPVVGAGAYDYVTCEECRNEAGQVVFAMILLGFIAYLVGWARVRFGRSSA